MENHSLLTELCFQDLVDLKTAYKEISVKKINKKKIKKELYDVGGYVTLSNNIISLKLGEPIWKIDMKNTPILLKQHRALGPGSKECPTAKRHIS